MEKIGKIGNNGNNKLLFRMSHVWYYPAIGRNQHCFLGDPAQRSRGGRGPNDLNTYSLKIPWAWMPSSLFMNSPWLLQADYDSLRRAHRVDAYALCDSPPRCQITNPDSAGSPLVPDSRANADGQVGLCSINGEEHGHTNLCRGFA
jgi:hypothetical protein